MKTCADVWEQLVLYSDDALEPGEKQRVGMHLEVCPECRAEYERIRAVIDGLRDPQLFSPAEDVNWQMLPDRIAARAGSAATRRRWIPTHFAARGWALSMAATLALACGLIWFVQQRAPVREQTAAAPAGSGNEAFLARIQAAYAREVTVEYLAECQNLMVNLLRPDFHCEGDRYDVSLEVVRAQQLLQRKRILEPELRRPEVARAKALCDEIENLLVNLSLAESCARPEEIQRMERFIERERILLRINLLQAELAEE